MGRRHTVAALVAILIIALAGFWWLALDGERVPESGSEVGKASVNRTHHPTPLDGRDNPSPPAADTDVDFPDDADRDDPRPEAAAAAEPALHAPGYGPAIGRGGADIRFEVFDALGNRLPLDEFACELHRKVGGAWVREDARVNVHDHTIDCLGLGDRHAPPTGLEPGEYELTVTSREWGGTRDEFSAARGDIRTGRVTMPTYYRAVSILFTHANGTPVDYLPWQPWVVSSSKPLGRKEHRMVPGVQLRDPPTKADESSTSSVPLGGGFGGGHIHLRPSKPPIRYPTDDGRWWVRVIAGSVNTVYFPLGEDLWGVDQYTFSDEFTGAGRHDVVLDTAADFDERVLKPGRVSESVEPGNRDLPGEPPPQVQAFDPLSASLGFAHARVVIDAGVPDDIWLERDVPGDDGPARLSGGGGRYWVSINRDETCRLRFAGPNGQHTDWEEVDTAVGGVVHIRRSADYGEVRISADPLSPALHAFAHSMDLQVGDWSLRLVRDGLYFRGTVLNPAGVNLAGATAVEVSFNGADRSVTPRALRRLEVELKEGVYYRNIRHTWEARVEPSPAQVRDRLAFKPTGGPASLDAIDLSGFEALALRAVDANGAGLPGVRGLVIPIEDDEVARRVRERTRALDDEGLRPRIQRASAEEYTGELEHVKDVFDASHLRRLIGDSVFDAFDTNAQRLWFARNGAWYSTMRTVRSDPQGYVTADGLKLEPGRVYALYLWSRSTDDLHPDARLLFKADDNCSADLGAVELPAPR